MPKTTNAIQERYMVAKALAKTLEAEHDALDHKYILENGIVNPDGSVPEYIWCIDDPELFEKVNAEQSELPEVKAHWEKVLVARNALAVAEEKLIEFGLSLAPAKQKAILEDAVKTNYKTRCEVIDLALKLDVSTIRSVRR